VPHWLEDQSLVKSDRFTPSAELFQLKGTLIRSAWDRIAYAINKGFHIEAIVILESLISDRIEAAVQSTQPERIKLMDLGKAITQTSIHEILDDSLRVDLDLWRRNRNKLTHEMVKLTDDSVSTWRERMNYARSVSNEGLRLAKEVDKQTKKFINSKKKQD
jgi:hypothetical protein